MPTLKDITIITPSKVHQDLESKFPGIQTINPVQTFKSYEDLLKVYFKALLKVNTKFFHFYDDDDKVPILPTYFPDTGIIFGDNLFFIDGKLILYQNNEWSFHRNFHTPTLIHRAICRTEDAISILEKVLDLPIVVDWWLYTHLAKNVGFYHDPEMLAYWEMKETGLHKRIALSRNFTRQYFKDCYPELK